jgi:alcohol dehydrogenase
VSCPPALTAHTGIDALIHAVEAFTARVREPADSTVYPGDVFRGKGFFSDVLTYRAIEKIGGALERAVRDGDDVAARSDLSLGSLCAGLGFGTAGTAAIHALQYPFGAATGTPHGYGIGLLAPYVLAYVRPACVPALAEVARALGVGADDDELASERAVQEIARLVDAIGIPRTLRDAGVEREQLRGFAEDAASIDRLMRNSPRPLDVDALESILEHAWAGEL